MTDPDSSGSPEGTVAGDAAARATEAFSVLGNETRLSILLSLWEAFEPFTEANAVPFSELRERVGVRDSGQFNYHLDKLAGQFVRKTDDGYELRRAGQQLVRTVIAGTGIEEPFLEPTAIDGECDFCGAPTAITYQDEWLYIVCTECDGFFGKSTEQPKGSLGGAALDPAGFANRRPEEMLHAAMTTAYRDLQSAIEGVCDACSGPIDSSLHVCDDHVSEGVCDTCGRRLAIMARFRCPVCKNHHTAPPRTIVIQHPAVVGFYYEHGVSLQYEGDDFGSSHWKKAIVVNHDQQLVSDDPIRVRVTIPYESDELVLTLDEDLDVIEVNRPYTGGQNG